MERTGEEWKRHSFGGDVVKQQIPHLSTIKWCKTNTILLVTPPQSKVSGSSSVEEGMVIPSGFAIRPLKHHNNRSITIILSTLKGWYLNIHPKKWTLIAKRCSFIWFSMSKPHDTTRCLIPTNPFHDANGFLDDSGTPARKPPELVDETMKHEDILHGN